MNVRTLGELLALLGRSDDAALVEPVRLQVGDATYELIGVARVAGDVRLVGLGKETDDEGE